MSTRLLFQRPREALERECELLTRRLTELVLAIKKHRHDIWGDGPVDHPHDAELYALVNEFPATAD